MATPDPLALAAALRGQRPTTSDMGVYGLITAPEEEDARMQAAAMAQALRGQRAAGNLGLLTGDRVLSGFGQAQIQGADKQEGMLADAGQVRSGNILKQALAGEEAKRQAKRDAEMDRHRRVMEAKPPSNVYLPGPGGQYMVAPNRGSGPVVPVAGPTGDPVFSPKADDIATAKANREADAATSVSNKVAADTKDISEAFDKSGGPNFYAKYGEVKDLLSKYKEDIPGFGKVDGLKPDLLVSDDALAMRQGVGQMLAEYRKGITGAGMSNAERTEYGQITGLLKSNNERSVRQGVERLRTAMDARMQAMAGGFRPEAVQTYAQRVPAFGDALGGSPVEPQEEEESPTPAPAPRPSIPPRAPMPPGELGGAPMPKPAVKAATGAPSRPDRKLDPTKKAVTRTVSKDKKWVREDYEDGTYGLAKNQ